MHPAQMSAVVLESVPTCPRCGFARKKAMPTDACVQLQRIASTMPRRPSTRARHFLSATVRRSQIRELGEQVAVGSHLVLCDLPIREDR